MLVFLCSSVHFRTIWWSVRLLAQLMLCFLIETFFLSVILSTHLKASGECNVFYLDQRPHHLCEPTLLLHLQSKYHFPVVPSLPPSLPLTPRLCSLFDLSCLTCKKLRKPKPLCPHLSVSCLSVMLNHFSFFPGPGPRCPVYLREPQFRRGSWKAR